MKRFHIIFSGRVQGVFFRARSSEKALSLGLTGSARNLRDGTVELEAQGEEASVDRLISWCRSPEGPGHVTEVFKTEIPVIEDEKEFEVF